MQDNRNQKLLSELFIKQYIIFSGSRLIHHIYQSVWQFLISVFLHFQSLKTLDGSEVNLLRVIVYSLFIVYALS